MWPCSENSCILLGHHDIMLCYSLEILLLYFLSVDLQSVCNLLFFAWYKVKMFFPHMGIIDSVLFTIWHLLFRKKPVSLQMVGMYCH